MAHAEVNIVASQTPKMCMTQNVLNGTPTLVKTHKRVIISVIQVM